MVFLLICVMNFIGGPLNLFESIIRRSRVQALRRWAASCAIHMPGCRRESVAVFSTEMKNFNWPSRAVVFLMILLFATSCGSASKDLKPQDHAISQLIPHTLHFRRTPVSGADPFAEPGGTDYRVETPPNERMNCEPVSILFLEIDLPKTRACLASIQEPQEVFFRLQRAPAPSLVLEDGEKTPPCLKELLPTIAVPREIFFETVEEAGPACYGARLDIEEDELFWVKLPIAKKSLRLEFPFEVLPQTDEETRLFLLSWVLTPFWNGTPRVIPSVYLPNSLCNRCLGEKNRVNRNAPPPILWP